MSDNFPNISGHSLPDIGVSDPGSMGAPNQSAGGMAKIKPTDMSGVSGQPLGNTMNKGTETDYTPTAGSSGYNIASAEIMTSGDPNNSMAR